MKNVEDFYPLSPLQQGMLFHSLYAPEAGLYVEQVSCTLRGPLHINAFKQAWTMILRRYPILRSAFIWEGVKDPIQAVFTQVHLPWDYLDWRGSPPAAQQAEHAAYCTAVRQRGIPTAEAPLMRMALLHISEDTYHFIWTYHHILLDGWSLPLVINDLMICYNALSSGKPPQLSPTRPYREYIIWLWQRDQAQAEAFWRQHLAGFTTPLHLWGTRAEHHEHTASLPHEHTRYLAPATTSALQTLVQQHQLTLNTLLQGAWAILLARYSGESDVLFGTTVSGRPVEIPGIEQMVGLFINTLPMRVTLPPTCALVTWLQHLQRLQIDMRQYEYSALTQIQGWSDVPRHLPLFESLVVFENYPTSTNPATTTAETTDRVIVQDMHVLERTNYPILIIAAPGESLMLKIAYEAERIDATHAARILGHLHTILEAMEANIAQPLNHLPILTADERRQTLNDWNATHATYPTDPITPHLIAQHAHHAPDALAILSEQTHLTYSELNQRANQLAHTLRDLDARPERIIGVAIERSPASIIALLGILKADAAYLPLDPTYPAARIAFMLADSHTHLVLTLAPYVACLPPPSPTCPHLLLDRDWDTIAQHQHSDPPPHATADNLAYLIYTSGSTGQPKGVLIPHIGLLNLIFWHIRTFRLTAADRTTLVAGVSFDASVWELWPTLAAGASIHIPDIETRLDPAHLHDWLTTHAITISFQPTLIAERLIAHPWNLHPSLRLLLTGGDRLNHRPIALPFTLSNNYGPTESSVVATSGTIDPAPDHPIDTAPPIGRPIANTHTYILDRALHPQPIGIVGELFIGSDGLARGYHGRPDLTAERFIPNPFAATHNAETATDNAACLHTRLYRTGDLVRWCPDGQLAFVGRADDQIKLRGIRIELGEIQTALLHHPAVQEALVTTWGDDQHKQLIAYLVCHNDTPAPTLRTYLRNQLPEHMIPTTFLFLDALPLNSNGKIDRHALPAPTDHPTQRNRPLVPPRTHLELQLTHIWETVLATHPIGVTDNFFDLGGHSILALRLASEIKKHLGATLPLSLIFQTPTIEHIATHLSTQSGAPPWSPLLPLQPTGTKTPFFCVHPVLGIAWGFAELARHLPDRPCYGLQARGLEDEQAPHTRIEDMAACYIEAIRSVQPHGPYILGGYSFGGYIAYEMAQQLRRQGENIALLVIIDTMFFVSHPDTHPERDTIEALIELAQNLENMSGKPLHADADDLRHLTPDQHLTRVQEWLAIVEIVPPDVAPMLMRGFQIIAPAAREAHQHYHIQPYDGPILLMRATHTSAQNDPHDAQAQTDDPTYGWQCHATQPIAIRTFPCTHTQIIIEPYVRDLAAQLTTYLDTPPTEP